MRQKIRQFAIIPGASQLESADLSDSIQESGTKGFYEETGAIRDVMQNHLFQVVSNLAMEPPARVDSESIRDEKVMAGDATVFARQDYVEEAWRIVDPILQAGTPIYQYQPQTWGPKEVNTQVAPPGGWHNPA